MKENFLKILYMEKGNLFKIISNQFKGFGKILYYFKIYE